jgi:hypothetical protein
VVSGGDSGTCARSGKALASSSFRPLRRSVSGGLRTCGKTERTPAHFQSEQSDGTRLSSGESGDRSWWKLFGCRLISSRSTFRVSPRPGVTGSDLRVRSRARGVGRATGPREAGTCTEKSEKAHESIDPHAYFSRRERISAGSKALKLRGIVTSWSSEQEHAMSETARGKRRREVHGSAEGKGSGG